jgi:hypothetical protein
LKSDCCHAFSPRAAGTVSSFTTAAGRNRKA